MEEACHMAIRPTADMGLLARDTLTNRSKPDERDHRARQCLQPNFVLRAVRTDDGLLGHDRPGWLSHVDGQTV